MQIEHDAVVLVADGRKLLFFRNKGDAAYPRLEAEAVTSQHNPADREQSSDAAGRSSSPQGGRQSSMEEVDFHDLEEQRFAADAVAILNRRALGNDYEKLIIVAPPPALGEMRKHYHKAVENRLIGEIAKDLVNHPVPDIERIIVES
ncbi:MAG: host attachment family protein, partial [Sphingobium sp.]